MRAFVLREGEQTPLYKYIILVGLLHLLLSLLFYGMVRIGEGVFFSSRTKELSIVQSSVQIDVVAMPKWTRKELLHMQGGEGTPPVPKRQDRADHKAKGSSFLEKIKQLSKKKIRRQKSRPSPSSKGTKFQGNSELKKLILAGNKLSSGTAFTGELSSGQLTQLRRYMESLPRFVRPHWVLPSYLKEQELRCRIRVFIGKGGKLLKTKIVESSGDVEYDSYALRAIARAELPSPDESLAKELVSGVVILGFPL